MSVHEGEAERDVYEVFESPKLFPISRRSLQSVYTQLFFFFS